MSVPRRHAQLALGSNLGDRLRNLRTALGRLAEESAVTAVSSLYLTEPVGGVEQPAFYNAACTILTAESLPELLARVKQIEWEMGRRPGPHWGPRPLDLDLLLAGEELVDTPALQVPHPQLAARAFVLAPLAEIAPAAVHPLRRRTVAELLAALPEAERADVRPVDAPTWAT